MGLSLAEIGGRAIACGALLPPLGGELGGRAAEPTAAARLCAQ
jgi:hypothetical protein